MENDKLIGRQWYPVRCDDCGVDTEVPFKPNPSRPVYCVYCYPKHSGQINKRMVPCDDCGNLVAVRQGHVGPAYCHECAFRHSSEEE